MAEIDPYMAELAETPSRPAASLAVERRHNAFFSNCSDFLYRNRWTVLWSMVAAFVGALLPYAGIPALAVYLIPLVPAIASLGLVALAAINAALFLSGAVVLGALTAGFNGLFTVLQGSESLNHPGANNLLDYALISVGKGIINTVGFVRSVVKSMSAGADQILIRVLKSRFWTAVCLFITGLLFALTFLSASSLVFAPVANCLIVVLLALVMLLLTSSCEPVEQDPLEFGSASNRTGQTPVGSDSLRHSDTIHPTLSCESIASGLCEGLCISLV